MALSRTSILNTMSEQAPMQQAQQQTGLEAANTASVRQAVAKVPAPMSKGQVQAAGGAAAATTGQQRLAGIEQGAKTQLGLGQQALATNAADVAAKTAERQLKLTEKQRQNENNLAALGAEVKQKLFDSNMNFQKDELGRTAFNERQMADWVVSKAKSAEDIRNYQQKVAEQSKRKLQYLKTVYDKLTQAMKQESSGNMQQMDQKSKESIYRAQAETKQRIADEIARSRSMAAIGTGIGTVVGAVGGAYFGGPAGGVAGAGAGGAVGGAVGANVGG